MQRNYIFLRGNISLSHKYSSTLFCKRLLSDIQLPLDLVLFSSRDLYTRAVRQDDEFVVVADPDNMVQIDQV